MSSSTLIETTAPIHHESRYHTAGVYVLPADEPERQRFEKQQKLISWVFDHQIVLPPVKLEGAEILDIGTGSGAWSLDVLKNYPGAAKATFNCVDIESALFPRPPPPNMTFNTMSVCDLSKEWTNKFSLVHQRLLLVGLKYHEWTTATEEIYRVVAPGGWIQLCEVNPLGEISGPSSKKMIQLVEALVEHTGLDFRCTDRLPVLLTAAGFVNVNTEKRSFTLGKWGGDLGKGLAQNQINVWRGMKTPILRAGGFGMIKNEEEFDTLIDEVEIEWEMFPGAEIVWYAFTAQKPTGSVSA